MKPITLLFVFIFPSLLLSKSLFAQSNEKGLKLSLQTDLIAYTTPGGWSIWGVVQHHQNKLSLAYVNFPNRYREIYDDTGIEELDRFARIQLARYFKPTSKLRNFFYGANSRGDLQSARPTRFRACNYGFGRSNASEFRCT